MHFARWRQRLHSDRGAIALFAALTLLVFRSALFNLGSRVVSSEATDMAYQFLPLRAFGMGELARGHIAQWNPYIYGGQPYMAGFQSALFYPLNWLHLIIALIPAINWLAALHVFLCAVTMYAWVRGRGASISGGVLAGLMFMFGGPVFLRVYAGHLSHLVVMPWPPLIMLAIDRLAASGRASWCLVGTAALTMAILGGSPQYVYYTGLITGAYVALLLVRSPHRARLVCGVGAMFLFASLLSCVQLLPGLAASRETVRSGGTTYAFASVYAMPPENILTAILPGFFGELRSDAHPGAIGFFGRTNLWETSLFLSITGLSLAGLAAVGRWRNTWPIVLVLLLSVALSLGRHLPIYRPLFDYMPLYASFRTTAKFGYFVALFMCPLAAEGLDLLRSGHCRRLAGRAAIAIGAMAVLLAVLSAALGVSAGSTDSQWAHLLRFIAQSGESRATTEWLSNYGSMQRSAINAEHEALWAALAAAATVAALVVAARRWPRASTALVMLAGAEMLGFAQSTWATCPVRLNFPFQWLAAVRASPGDYRVVNPGDDPRIVGTMDQGMMLGIRNVWGYDPSVLKRYAETMFAAQGQSADSASQYLRVTRDIGGVFQMLRARFELQHSGSVYDVAELPDPLPIAQLVSGYQVAAGRDAVLAAVTADTFDPRKTVILEHAPTPAPSPNGTTGAAQAIAVSTDAILIHAVVERPTLLLVTENYSSGWRVAAVHDSASQQRYTLLPANWTLMAIPLEAGTHDIRLDYQSPGYAIGKAVSAVSLVAFLSLTVLALKRSRFTE